MASLGVYEDVPLTIKTEEIEIFSELPEEDINSETSQGSAENSAVPNISNRFKCYICSKPASLENRDCLREHLMTAHPLQESYHCGECNLSTSQIIAFNNHLTRHDPSIRPYKCNHCPLRYYAKLQKQDHEFKKHGINHEKAQRYCCTICEEKFLFRHMLKKHLHTKHNQVQERLKLKRNIHKCNMCPGGTAFDCKTTLNQHLTKNHELKARYYCDKCDISVELITSFNFHLARHDEKRPHGCSVCSLRFNTFYNKLNHEVAIHKINNVGLTRPSIRDRELKFSCSVCERKFPYLNMLKQHEQRKHNAGLCKEKCFSCVTNNVFDDKKALLKHFEDVHPVKKRTTYRCNECGYAVQKMIKFNHHLSLHDPISRPHKCSHCEKRFTVRRTKLRHEASIHGVNDGSSRSCSDCGETFRNKQEVLSHQRTLRHGTAAKALPEHKDTEEDKKCLVCNQMFTNKSRRIQHQRHKHGTISSVENHAITAGIQTQSESEFANEVQGTALNSQEGVGTNHPFNGNIEKTSKLGDS